VHPRRGRRDLPVALADVAGLLEEVQVGAGVELGLPLRAALEQLLPARVERAVQLDQQRLRLGREDLGVPALDGRVDRQAFDGVRPFVIDRCRSSIGW
jgi:hypothetical protein